MQDFARALPDSAEGLIVNMLDERVWSLTPHFVSYTLSKAGLWALTQSMALALAPRIRVNGIGPGPTVPSPRQTPAQFARQAASVPLRRASSPEEVARTVLAMLALPSLTGQMIAIDGGQHLRLRRDAFIRQHRLGGLDRDPEGAVRLVDRRDGQSGLEGVVAGDA